MIERRGRHDDVADVCLVLEGTYPFVMGGVSQWVHHLVRELPDVSFGVVHISPRRGYYAEGPVYELPDNVRYVREVALVPDDRRFFGETPPDRPEVTALWDEIAALRAHAEPDDVARLLDSAEALADDGLTADDVLACRASWDALLAAYEAEAPGESFMNFFWNWRFALQPLVSLLFHRAPRAGLYHTVSTGYAGMLAAAAARRHGRPMVLTEHGIYTRERRIELYAAPWIRDRECEEFVVDDRPPYFRQFWGDHFERMSRFCYREATRVYTLFGANRDVQIREGADPERTFVIPNGVDTERLEVARREAPERPADAPFTVAFVGRVTPIKDVRTFLAAMGLVAPHVPDLHVRVLGPTTEDPDYAEGCMAFARELGLGSVVHFEGPVDVKRELPHCDLLVLTSISEAQPLVILEAGAMGVPSVATDVGSVRELLEGRTPEDRILGLGGLVTPIASPGSTAKAVLELYEDREMRLRLGRNQRERVRRFYDQRDVVRRYREVYRAISRDAAATTRVVEGLVEAVVAGDGMEGED